MLLFTSTVVFFFFNDTATTEIYTFSLHDALPILQVQGRHVGQGAERVLLQHVEGFTDGRAAARWRSHAIDLESPVVDRSEEHTSELQSRQYLVCRLLLEKKKKMITDAVEIYDHQE